MRLFLALDLPDDARTHLTHLQRTWSSLYTQQWGGHPRDFSLTKPPNLHVTLKFLGEVPDPALTTLLPTLQSLNPVGPIPLHATTIQYFPPRGPIRVIVADLAGDLPRLQLVYAQLESLCHSQGFPREHRPFHPHVTLARARAGLPGKFRPATPAHPWPPGPPFSINHITLYQSHLKPAGPEYIKLASIPF